MNVTIIYGTTRKANTYNCVQLLLNNLKLNMNIKVTEFFLPKDLPPSCSECTSCLINSATTCTHFNDTDFITQSLDKSDLIILACPVSTCDITKEMKLLLDHLSYKYIQNKQNSFMENKIGLVVSTASGAGLSYTTKTLKKNLALLGINNTLKFSKTLYEINWDQVNLKTKKKIKKKIFKLSCEISNLYNNLETIKAPTRSKVAFLQNRSTFKECHCQATNFANCKK